MTALANPVDAASRLLTELRDLNAANALIAAKAMTPIVERLAIEGHLTQDLDLSRKVLESLQKVAVHPEKQDSANKTAAAAQAILTIVLDDTPQAAPPKRARRLPVEVVDAVEIKAQPSSPEPVPATSEDVPWGDA